MFICLFVHFSVIPVKKSVYQQPEDLSLFFQVANIFPQIKCVRLSLLSGVNISNFARTNVWEEFLKFCHLGMTTRSLSNVIQKQEKQKIFAPFSMKSSRKWTFQLGKSFSLFGKNQNFGRNIYPCLFMVKSKMWHLPFCKNL